jgi:hypothetical protein
MYAVLKRLLLGRPLRSAEQEHQRLIKLIALAIFSCRWPPWRRSTT